MQDLLDNKPMMYVLGGGWCFGMLLVIEGIGIGELVELVELPTLEFRAKLFAALALDTAAVWAVETATRWKFHGDAATE